MDNSSYIKYIEGQIQDLERYTTIVDYFAEKENGVDINKGRVNANRDYLQDILSHLVFAGSNYPGLKDKAFSLSGLIKDLLGESN